MSNLAKYFYGSRAVANEILTTPVNIAELGDSIAVAMETYNISMLPSSFPFGGRFSPAGAAYTNPTFGTTVYVTNVDSANNATVQYLTSGNYSISNAIEHRENGTTAGVNTTTFTNRLWDGAGLVDTNTAILGASRLINWGGVDRLAGIAFQTRALFYGGANPPANLQAVVRRTTDNVTTVGNVALPLTSNGYSSVVVPCTAATAAADDIFFMARLPDNGTTVNLSSFACLGYRTELLVPNWTYNSFAYGGFSIDRFLDPIRFSSAAYLNTMNMLNITHCKIHLGTNELDANTEDGFVTKLLALIALVRQGNPTMGIWLQSTYQSLSATASKLVIISKAMIRVANMLPRVFFVDLYNMFPTYALNAPLLSDTTHPNTAGKQTFVAASLNIIKEGLAAPATGVDSPKIVNFPLAY